MLCLLWPGSYRHPNIAKRSMTNVFACWALLYTWCLIYAGIGAACTRNNKCCARWWSGAGLHSASNGRSMEIYILYAEDYHVHSIWSMLSPVVWMWDMINAVSANGLMPTCIQPWADTAWNLYFLYAEHCHVRGIWSMLSVVVCKKKTVLCLLMA